MTLRMTGVSGLTLMMRAERAHRSDLRPDRGAGATWRLFGPQDPDGIEAEDEAAEQLLAAE